MNDLTKLEIFNKQRDTSHCEMYQHNNGLKHINVTKKGNFSAVFVVNTPALDDSGVSHAVEHFIFRRSQLFSQAETLFQLVALTDLKINASTLSNKTYFHCQSGCFDSFILGMKYLLSGILTPNFVEEDLTKEITNHVNGGVIYRELNSSQFNKSDITQKLANMSDLTDERCHQYAGTCQTISTISLDDLKQYHQQFYQANKITLITSNTPPKHFLKLIEAMVIDDNSKKNLTKAVKEYKKRPLLDIKVADTDKVLIRYWLLDEFFSYIEYCYNDLVEIVTAYDAELLPLQRNLNKDYKFPLDIISNRKSKCHCEIDSRLNYYLKKHYQYYLMTYVRLSGDSSANCNHQKKYSPEINHLISVYENYQKKVCQTNKKTNETLLILGKARIHKLAGLNSCTELTLETDRLFKQVMKVNSTSNQAQAIVNKIKNDECRLMSELEQLSLCLKPQMNNINNSHQARLVAIPETLLPLYQIALRSMSALSSRHISKLFDLNHSLIVVENKENDEALFTMLSYIISAYPKFLSARCQGKCYLITAQYYVKDKCLVLFSAFDSTPSVRVTAISHDLLSLSQDKRFIEATILLARIKYQQLCQGNADQAEKITVREISSYLKNLGRKLLEM